MSNPKFIPRNGQRSAAEKEMLLRVTKLAGDVTKFMTWKSFIAEVEKVTGRQKREDDKALRLSDLTGEELKLVLMRFAVDPDSVTGAQEVSTAC